MRPELERLVPPAVALLPRSKNGWPIPWFVARRPGEEPDLRFACPQKRLRAYRDGLCWVCGARLGRHHVFVGGPLSVANLAFSDWCSHEACAMFAATACPALNGEMSRRPGKAIPEEARTPFGTIEGLPPLAGLLYARSAVRFNRQLRLFHPTPVRVRWWADGVELAPAAALTALREYLPAQRFSDDDVAAVARGKE